MEQEFSEPREAHQQERPARNSALVELTERSRVVCNAVDVATRRVSLVGRRSFRWSCDDVANTRWTMSQRGSTGKESNIDNVDSSKLQ